MVSTFIKDNVEFRAPQYQEMLTKLVSWQTTEGDKDSEHSKTALLSAEYAVSSSWKCRILVLEMPLRQLVDLGHQLW